MFISQGTILVLEHGEYSDYSFAGPFRVLRGFDQKSISDAFRSQWKPQDDWDVYPSEAEFIGWLSSNGYIEDIDAHSWHIGSYRFDPSIQDDPS